MRALLVFLLVEVVRGQGNCPPMGFECNNGKCITSRYFCNGRNDCRDGSDEIYAGTFEVGLNFTTCRRNWDERGQNQTLICLLPERQFDREEELCQIDKKCSTGFLCGNGRCIETTRFCDGHDDCLDGSDEIPADTYVAGSNFSACRKHWDDRSQKRTLICLLPRSQFAKKQELCRIDAECSQGFSCGNERCIAPNRFCNGRDDCLDGSDEMPIDRTANVSNSIPCRQNWDTIGKRSILNCLLPERQSNKTQMLCKIDIQCSQGFLCDNDRCIEPTNYCNGWDDCSDGSDEKPASNTMNIANFTACRQHWNHRSKPTNLFCLLPASQSTKFQMLCTIDATCSQGFVCENGGCIQFKHFCDGWDDCKDRSDEKSASEYVSGTNFTACRQYWDNPRKIRGTLSCLLPTSQSAKNQTLCKIDASCSQGFSCDNGRCFQPSIFCNGKSECLDGLDEIPANTNANATNSIACRRNWDHWLTKGTLICELPESQSSKKGVICTIDTECSVGFSCGNGRCVEPRRFCNIQDDCLNGADEIPANTTKKGPNDIACRQNWDERKNKRPLSCLLPEIQSTKKQLLCTIDVTCSQGFLCDNGRCIEPSAFCNKFDECLDGSDEIPANGSINGSNFIDCRQTWDLTYVDRFLNCLLPKSQSTKKDILCKIDAQCSQGLSCNNGRCITPSAFCNGYDDCLDNTDEEMKPSDRECDLIFGQPKCSVPEQFICNEYTNCRDGIDECLCGSGGLRLFLDDKCFRCLSDQRVVIPNTKLCDGNIDCPDLSDECLCELETRPPVCNEVFWEKNAGERIPQANVLCQKNKTETVLGVSNLCEKTGVCDNIQVEKSCNIQSSGSSKSMYYCDRRDRNVPRCDGVIDCIDKVFFEECNDCGLSTPEICRKIELTSSFFELCNGKLDSISGVDELNCPGWFYCDNAISVVSRGEVFRVNPGKVCDGNKDCPDGSDESDCPPFKCNDTGVVKYQPVRRVCDGTLNCAEGADECQDRCIVSVFSDTKMMIKNGGVVGVVWFIALTAVIGNALVIAFTTRDAMSKHNLHKESWKRDKLNRIIVLNLSISDFLVGIYTMAIAIKNSMQRGNYCLVDHEWRASSTCTIIGAFLVIGSQNSVFTMLLITFFRVRATSRTVYQPSFKKYLVALSAAWIVSIMLSIIPVIPALEDYFVDSIWYDDNALFSTIDLNRADDMLNWLLMMRAPSNNSEPISNLQSWATLEKLISEMNPNFTVKRRHGFYSTHTVCLPTFFPNRKTDTAWWYSLLLIVINMTSFVVMLAGYIKIYRSATSKNLARTGNMRKERATSMQVKLSRIMVTDFCCWIPICIMGFVQLAGVDVTTDAYLPVALIILPINSSLNPFLYSNVPDFIWEKIKFAFSWLWSRIRRASASEERTEEQEEIELDKVKEAK